MFDDRKLRQADKALDSLGYLPGEFPLRQRALARRLGGRAKTPEMRTGQIVRGDWSSSFKKLHGKAEAER